MNRLAGVSLQTAMSKLFITAASSTILGYTYNMKYDRGVGKCVC
jgi:hypothetical protein